MSSVLPPGSFIFRENSLAGDGGTLLRGHANVDVKMAEVTSADLSTRTVETADGKKYQGDFLILAAGAQVNLFGTTGAEKHAYPLYSLSRPVAPFAYSLRCFSSPSIKILR